MPVSPSSPRRSRSRTDSLELCRRLYARLKCEASTDAEKRIASAMIDRIRTEHGFTEEKIGPEERIDVQIFGWWCIPLLDLVCFQSTEPLKCVITYDAMRTAFYGRGNAAKEAARKYLELAEVISREAGQRAKIVRYQRTPHGLMVQTYKSPEMEEAWKCTAAVVIARLWVKEKRRQDAEREAKTPVIQVAEGLRLEDGGPRKEKEGASFSEDGKETGTGTGAAKPAEPGTLDPESSEGRGPVPTTDHRPPTNSDHLPPTNSDHLPPTNQWQWSFDAEEWATKWDNPITTIARNP